MRTIEVKAYKVSELPEDLKEKIIEKYSTINVDDSFWYESILDEWKEKLAEQGFENAEIYFNGFWSQGDGACFDADVDLEKLIRLAYKKNPDKRDFLLALIADDSKSPPYEMSCSIQKNSYANHYSHSNTRYINLEIENSDIVDILFKPLKQLALDMTEEKYQEYLNIISLRLKYGIEGDIVKELEEDLDNWRKSLCAQIYKELEAEYDYQTTSKAILETLEANDYEFDEDGDKI
jgi:hypothetical protein